MLNPERAELESAYNAAIASAELLRQSGEVAKAERVESLARIIARKLNRRPADHQRGSETRS